MHLTDHFTVLEPHNSSIDIFLGCLKHGSTDCMAQKLRNILSGIVAGNHLVPNDRKITTLFHKHHREYSVNWTQTKRPFVIHAPANLMALFTVWFVGLRNRTNGYFLDLT